MSRCPRQVLTSGSVRQMFWKNCTNADANIAAIIRGRWELSCVRSRMILAGRIARDFRRH